MSDGSGSEGEFKLYGRAVGTSDPAIIEYEDAWWTSRPRDQFEVYAIEIAEAVLVLWDPDFNRMRTTRWSRRGGEREATRSYP